MPEWFLIVQFVCTSGKIKFPFPSDTENNNIKECLLVASGGRLYGRCVYSCSQVLVQTCVQIILYLSSVVLRVVL